MSQGEGDNNVGGSGLWLMRGVMKTVGHTNLEVEISDGRNQL